LRVQFPFGLRFRKRNTFLTGLKKLPLSAWYLLAQRPSPGYQSGNLHFPDLRKAVTCGHVRSRSGRAGDKIEWDSIREKIKPPRGNRRRGQRKAREYSANVHVRRADIEHPVSHRNFRQRNENSRATSRHADLRVALFPQVGVGHSAFIEK